MITFPEILALGILYGTVGFALVFGCLFLLLFSVVLAFGFEVVEQVIVLMGLWFFPLLFGAYMLWPFRTVRRDQHVRFFLFWAALATLPFAVLLSAGLLCA